MLFYLVQQCLKFFDITKKILNNPKKILVKTEQLTLEGIKQFYINVERE